MTKLNRIKKIQEENFDQLLDTCAAIEEEMLFSSAPSRLDYFKSGVQYEKRVGEKKVQLKKYENNDDLDSIDDVPRGIKRAKTNH